MVTEEIVDDMFEMFEKLNEQFDKLTDQAKKDLIAELFNKFCKLHN